MQGLSAPVPVPNVDAVVVVARVASSTDAVVGARVIAATVGASAGVSVGVPALKSSAGMGAQQDLDKRATVNPIASTMATNTNPIANFFPLMFLHLLTEVVLGSELKSKS